MQIDMMIIDNEVNMILMVYFYEEKFEFYCIDKCLFILVILGGGYGFCSEREVELIVLKFVVEGYYIGVLCYYVGEYCDFYKVLVDVEKSMDLIVLLVEKVKID